MNKISKKQYLFFSSLKKLTDISDLGRSVFRILKRDGVLGVFTKMEKIYKRKNKSFTKIDDISYNAWLMEYHQITTKKIDEMRNQILQFSIIPKISIIMPTYNSNAIWLKKAIDSVINQIYQNWELCISDDASTKSECKKVLKEYQYNDSRIKVIYRNNNGHISQCSNSAIKISTGEWLALFDHDDILPVDALFWVVKEINKNPDAKLIYSDEDKITTKGYRKDPYFKCDWNYDLFLSQNMISHLGVYKSDIVKEISGFRKGYEGSQDYDLALRFIEKINHNQIIHIPRILYHWRIHKHSTAKIVDKKPYALTAAKKALEDHLSRQRINANVSIIPKNNMYRIQYYLDNHFPSVNIIIPTKNNKTLLQKCIESIIKKTKYSNYVITVVDNNSDDPSTIDYIETIKNTGIINVLHYAKKFNFSSINNMAVDKSNSEYICFLNDDIEVISEDWLTEMVSISVQPEVGAVGAKLKYPDNTLQHGGVILGVGGIGSHSHKGINENTDGYFNRAGLIQSISAVTGACLLVKKNIFDKVHGFNETNLAIAYNDIDLCLKIKQLGYRNIWTPFAELYHHESVSRGKDTNEEGKVRLQKESDYMYRKWGNCIKNDPAYSPNLTLLSDSFTLAWPPRLKV